MEFVVPFDAVDPNTRLSPLLDGGERLRVARAMLGDVLAVLDSAGYEPTVLSTAAIECAAPVIVDDRPLTPAVNDILADSEDAIAIVMADLALVTTAALERLVAPDADVVLAPGLGGGTNAIVARHPDFRVDYHGLSVRDHREAATTIGASVATVDSFRLSVDVDEPSDLTEVLLHTDGETAATLRALGVTLGADGGRVAVRREE